MSHNSEHFLLPHFQQHLRLCILVNFLNLNLLIYIQSTQAKTNSSYTSRNMHKFEHFLSRGEAKCLLRQCGMPCSSWNLHKNLSLHWKFHRGCHFSISTCCWLQVEQAQPSPTTPTGYTREAPKTFNRHDATSSQTRKRTWVLSNLNPNELLHNIIKARPSHLQEK